MWTAGLIIVVAVSVVSAELGSCPSHPKVHDGFDMEKYAGKWYVIEETPSLDKMLLKCSRYVVEFREKGKAGLLHKYILSLSGKQKSDYSDVTTPKISEPAKVLISPLKGTLLGKKKNVAIIDTDYETYSITYSCTNLLLAHHQDIHILSRTKTLDDKKKMEIYEILKTRNINQKNLASVDQNDEDCTDD